MKTVLLAAGALALTLGAGQALANTHHKHHKGAMASAMGPKQPIPYAELSAYLKASPSQRAKKDWWSGQPALASNSSAASSGANASATTPSATTTAPATPGPSSTDTTAPGANPANPAPSSTSGSALPPATGASPPPTDTPPSSSATPPTSDTTPPK